MPTPAKAASRTAAVPRVQKKVDCTFHYEAPAPRRRSRAKASTFGNSQKGAYSPGQTKPSSTPSANVSSSSVIESGADTLAYSGRLVLRLQTHDDASDVWSDVDIHGLISGHVPFDEASDGGRHSSDEANGYNVFEGYVASSEQRFRVMLAYSSINPAKRAIWNIDGAAALQVYFDGSEHPDCELYLKPHDSQTTWCFESSADGPGRVMPYRWVTLPKAAASNVPVKDVRHEANIRLVLRVCSNRGQKKQDEETSKDGSAEIDQPTVAHPWLTHKVSEAIFPGSTSEDGCGSLAPRKLGQILADITLYYSSQGMLETYGKAGRTGAPVTVSRNDGQGHSAGGGQAMAGVSNSNSGSRNPLASGSSTGIVQMTVRQPAATQNTAKQPVGNTPDASAETTRNEVTESQPVTGRQPRPPLYPPSSRQLPMASSSRPIASGSQNLSGNPSASSANLESTQRQVGQTILRTGEAFASTSTTANSGDRAATPQSKKRRAPDAGNESLRKRGACNKSTAPSALRNTTVIELDTDDEDDRDGEKPLMLTPECRNRFEPPLRRMLNAIGLETERNVTQLLELGFTAPSTFRTYLEQDQDRTILNAIVRVLGPEGSRRLIRQLFGDAIPVIPDECFRVQKTFRRTYEGCIKAFLKTVRGMSDGAGNLLQGMTSADEAYGGKSFVDLHVEILLECSFKGSKSFAVYLAKNEDRREVITRRLVSELGVLAADNVLKALKGEVAVRAGTAEGMGIPKLEPA